MQAALGQHFGSSWGESVQNQTNLGVALCRWSTNLSNFIGTAVTTIPENWRSVTVVLIIDYGRFVSAFAWSAMQTPLLFVGF